MLAVAISLKGLPMNRLAELDRVERSFRSARNQVIHAVNGVSLRIDRGETLALIGESGSGKSTVGRLVLGLLKPMNGTVYFDGLNLDQLPDNELRRTRSRMQAVFQEPFESLNPKHRIGDIVAEPLVIHERELTKEQRRSRVVTMLETVGLEEGFLRRYPKELSGGQQQRVGIARAMVTRPEFVVLDEPTSSLDLSVRAQILDLLLDLQQNRGLGYLFISHDIETVRYISNRIAVMYLGSVVETGPTEEICAEPKHPYTKALLSASLSVDPTHQTERINLIGDPPSPGRRSEGCVLCGRCPIELPECLHTPIHLRTISEHREVACIHPEV
jgi:oligopeptide/dipeptide ABC transporter ATP-binding protein